jgi:TonB-dependent SusC/RagA subfamily outer membrane receptor
VRRLGFTQGKQTVVVTSGGTTTVDVGLEPAPTALDEVVTTATGEQRVRELGHVVGRINADSLVREAPIASVTEMLTSRVPGLMVRANQGTVGGDAILQVRTTNSVWLNPEPIVIVDGVRYLTNPRFGQSQSLGVTFNNDQLGPFGNEGTSRLNDLNPNDIESVEVVKGPSAATLYGTDAANGVIVITTKRGKAGPARWNAYGRAASTEIPRQRYPDIYWGWSAGSATSSCTLRLEARGSCKQDSVTVIPNPLSDPALTIFASKPRWEYGANVSGGSRDFRYYFATDVEDATGPIQLPPALVEAVKARRGVDKLPQELREPNAFSKLNLRSNVSAAVSQKLDLRVAAGYTQSATRTLNVTPFGGGMPSATPAEPFPPNLSPDAIFAQTSTERINRFTGSATGEWRPSTWLLARAMAGLDLTNSNRYSLARPGEVPNTVNNSGVVGEDRTRYLVSTAELGTTASFRFSRVSSRTSIGAQYVRNLNDRLASIGRNLPPGRETIGAAATISARQAYMEKVTLGGYFEQVVGLNDRLYLTGAVRADGASGFGQDYRAAFYPKASVSWIASEEPWLPKVPGLDELRLRYAFGASGQQPWATWANPSFRVDQSFADGAAGHKLIVTGMGNPDLRPERVREHEVGIDAAALQGRVRLDLTWNRRETVDGLTQVGLTPGLGTLLGSYWTNIGRITGRGVEAQITARPLDARKVSWDVAFSHAWHADKLEKLGGAGNRNPNIGWVEGYPLGARFTYPILGYEDVNGDGILDRTEVQIGDSMVYVGRSTPPRTQTLSSIIGLFQQRVRISALLDRQSGFVQQAMPCDNRCRAAVDRTAPLAEQAKVVADQEKGLFGTGYVTMEPGDFTRLREVSVSLELPDRLVRAARLTRGAFSLSVRNLALWTAYGGADPESRFNTLLPQSRAWTARFDAGF